MIREAIIGTNTLEFINILFNIWKNGNSAVLIDYSLPRSVIIHLLKMAGVQHCYVERQLFVSFDFIDTTFYDSSHEVKELTYDIRKEYKYCDARDEALVVFTSGSTGVPKGVILSHFSIVSNAKMIIEASRITGDDSILMLRKLCYSSSVVGELMVAIISKARLYLSPVSIHPRLLLCYLHQYEITRISLNSGILSMIVAEQLKNPQRISLLKYIHVNGGPLSPALSKKAQSTFPNCRIIHEYGLTEAGPRVSTMTELFNEEGSSGGLLKDVEVKILDDDGKLLKTYEVGNIYIKSPSLFSGYIDEERKCEDGWFSTGDLGYMSPGGCLFVNGRKNGVVAIHGHKVSICNIERTILSCEGVIECCVVVVDINGGCLCCQYIGNISIANLRIQLSTKLALYEIPKFFIANYDIPRLANGKIDYYKVKRIFENRLNK